MMRPSSGAGRVSVRYAGTAPAAGLHPGVRTCPVTSGRRYVDWYRPDPEGAGPDDLRRIRDDGSARVDLLLHELRDA